MIAKSPTERPPLGMEINKIGLKPLPSVQPRQDMNKNQCSNITRIEENHLALAENNLQINPILYLNFIKCLAPDNMKIKSKQECLFPSQCEKKL